MSMFIIFISNNLLQMLIGPYLINVFLNNVILFKMLFIIHVISINFLHSPCDHAFRIPYTKVVVKKHPLSDSEIQLREKPTLQGRGRGRGRAGGFHCRHRPELCKSFNCPSRLARSLKFAMTPTKTFLFEKNLCR